MLFEDVTAAWGGEPDIGDGRGLAGSCGIDVSMGGRVLQGGSSFVSTGSRPAVLGSICGVAVSVESGRGGASN